MYYIKYLVLNTIEIPGQVSRVNISSHVQITCYFQSINQSIILFSNAGLQSGSHKADVDLQWTNEM